MPLAHGVGCWGETTTLLVLPVSEHVRAEPESCFLSQASS